MSLSAHWSRFLRTSPTMARIQESWLLAHRGSCRLPGCGIIEDAEFIEVYYSDTGRISADQSESRSSRKLSARAGRVDVLPGCVPWFQSVSVRVCAVHLAQSLSSSSYVDSTETAVTVQPFKVN